MGHLKAYLHCVAAVTIACTPLCPSGSAQQESASRSQPSIPSVVKESIGLTGSLRLDYWSVTRDLDGRRPIGSAMLWAKGKHDFSPKISAFGEAWLMGRGPIGNGQARGELREAYVDLKLDRFEFRAGRQIFAWGRADAINPTANLSGEDLPLLTPDSEDRKFGTTAIRMRYFLPHSLSVSSIWLPEFRPTRFPFPVLNSGTTFVRKSPHWPADQFAIRVEQNGTIVDWSASYFDGYDLLPDLSTGNDAQGSAQIKVSHHRLRVIGADAATNAGHYGFRAEGAYTETQNSSGKDPFIRKPYVFVILGGDRTYGGELNINLQYIFRFVTSYHSAPAETDRFTDFVATEESIIGSQTARVQHGASARLDDKWLHETLEAELGVVGYFNPKGILVRPKVTYSISDRWKAIIGGEIYRGDDRSVFGLLRTNSAGYIETRFSF